MKKTLLKWLGVFLVALPVGLYTAFVAQCFWNWFAVPVLHVSEVSFLEMLGLLWLIQLLTSRHPAADDKRWALLASLIELCVPPERQQELSELREGNPLATMIEGFSAVFGQVVGNTVTLVLGFALHLLIS
jgi:hypothetical protein